MEKDIHEYWCKYDRYTLWTISKSSIITIHTHAGFGNDLIEELKELVLC